MDELKWSLQELYSSALYSDFTIICREERYLVHKAIICPRSDFFAAACRAGLKEEREGKINFDDDNPIAVASMVYYFYHLDYNPTRLSRPGNALLVDDQQGLHSARTNAELLTHAQVYALAEKYSIKGLKSLALQKFKVAIRCGLSKDWIEDFLTAAEEAFASTVETDKDLREIVLKTFHQHPELIVEDKTQALLQRDGNLTFDLLMYKHHQDNPF